MYGLMIAMTLFPARMMALILGTSLRSAEEETPSDEVETLILFLHEVCLVALGSLCMRYFVRDTLASIDMQMVRPSDIQPWIQLLDKDAQRRMVTHRERFTAPFCMFDKTGRVFAFWSYVSASGTRSERLKKLASGVLMPSNRGYPSI
jgi:hypothetical protein